MANRIGRPPGGGAGGKPDVSAGAADYGAMTCLDIRASILEWRSMSEARSVLRKRARVNRVDARSEEALRRTDARFTDRESA
jgi:hypothetical protein